MKITINENNKVIHKRLRGRPPKYSTDKERKEDIRK